MKCFDSILNDDRAQVQNGVFKAPAQAVEAGLEPQHFNYSHNGICRDLGIVIPQEHRIFRGDPEYARILDDMVRVLQILVPDDGIVELRVPKFGGSSGSWLPWSRWYGRDQLGELAEKALELNVEASGVYVTLNPVNADLLERNSNRYRRKDGSGKFTRDQDIACRRFLLVDLDLADRGDRSTSEAEKAGIKLVAEHIRAELSARGWPMPIFADSGNGYHLLYRINLPTNDGGTVYRVLTALANEFNQGSIQVDLKVANASRISKLYGTMACKGEDSPEFPYRRSCVLELPELLEIVPNEKLEEIAKDVPEVAVAHKTFGAVPIAIDRGKIRPDKLRHAQAYLNKVPGAI